MEYDWIWEYQNPLKDPDGSLGIYKDARERESTSNERFKVNPSKHHIWPAELISYAQKGRWTKNLTVQNDPIGKPNDLMGKSCTQQFRGLPCNLCYPSKKCVIHARIISSSSTTHFFLNCSKSYKLCFHISKCVRPCCITASNSRWHCYLHWKMMQYSCKLQEPCFHEQPWSQHYRNKSGHFLFTQ